VPSKALEIRIEARLPEGARRAGTCGGKNVDDEAQQSRDCQRAEDYSPPAFPSQAARSGHRRGGGYPASMPRQLVVIDSQSLFDWLVFRDPVCVRWPAALAGPDWEWIFTSDMKAEFDFVAAKGFGARWPVDAEAVASAWSHHGREVPAPPPPGAGTRLHCTDPDDQKFIDLAVAGRAQALVTRDKALLRLARKALALHGLRICRPAEWSAGLGG
jgi:hypothetical protein